MTTTPTGLPPLSDDTVDRIEEAVFAQIAEERDTERAHTALTRRRARRRGWLTAGGVAAAFAVGVLVTPAILNATGAASSGSSAASAPYDTTPRPQSLSGVAKDMAPSSGGAASSAGGSAPSTNEARDVIRTGSATVQVDDVRKAADALAALAKKHGGFVESQQIGSAQGPVATDGGIVPPPSGDGWVTLRVPVADLDAVMDALREQGTVLATSIGTNDVTTATTDLRAQIDSLTASVTRLTQLMSQATSVSDLLTAETALTDRQSQLQSAQQQLKDLESQVAMSSVQVTLVREAPAAADPAGFGDGLAAGWKGLIVSLNALVIALGFLLPWLALALVVALIVWAIVRTRRARRTRRAIAGSMQAAETEPEPEPQKP
ncbi:DUF4349 domain-containing protein [Microbacterium azadirachtae]|uniref:DUF4349 domain-containing protein n=1 Tax=Microbacterium azadirachtae TaxID=582680 RepID=A0A0F0LRM9_9MICO|nr:DUF4349 domain-containing protein [Microbacterium azadirachtae]KJL35887.1 hypothetical protein RS86_00427 [Microbacterium azadirachtae]